MGDRGHHAAHRGQFFGLMELGFKLAVTGHTPLQSDFCLAGHELQKEEKDEGRYGKTAKDEPLRAYGTAVLGRHILNYLKNAEYRYGLAVQSQAFEVAVNGKGKDGTQQEGSVCQIRRDESPPVGNGGKNVEVMGLAFEYLRHAFGEKVGTARDSVE